MIVVDSSAFIEFYRSAGSPDVQDAVAAAIADDEVAVNGIIRVEICAFASGESERRLLEADFEAFHGLELDERDFAQATDLGYQLRRQGLTIPATDLIIAASAIRADARLLHRDAHFDQIALYSDLRVRSFAPS